MVRQRVAALCFSLLLVLTGCTQTVDVPYLVLESGEHRVCDKVGDRDVLPTDLPPLSYFTADTVKELEPISLYFYSGDLYALSNYRKLLLDMGASIVNEKSTPEYLDTLLLYNGSRVRLLYTRAGTIRILVEDSMLQPHIIMKEK